MDTKLSSAIEQFLSEKREIVDGGWAEVRDEDVSQLYDIVYLLVKEKFAPDCDGDRPIDVTIIDRTKFRGMAFQPVPYHRSDNTLTDAVLEDHLSNLTIALNDVTNLLRIRRYEQSRKKL
jgi:hypothetical protein